MKFTNGRSPYDKGTYKAPFKEIGVYKPRWNSEEQIVPDASPVAAIPVYIVDVDEEKGGETEGY